MLIVQCFLMKFLLCIADFDVAAVAEKTVADDADGTGER